MGGIVDLLGIAPIAAMSTPGDAARKAASALSFLGANTIRKWRAVTGAKLTVVGTLVTGISATLRQSLPSSLTSSRGSTVAPKNITEPPGMKKLADRTVCGLA